VRFGVIALVFVGGARALPQAGKLDDTSFEFDQQFYGAQAYTDPAASADLGSGMATGVELSPPVDAGMAQFVQSRMAGLIVQLPGAATAAGMPAEYIEAQRSAMANVAANLPNVTWNLMPEWDQSGGPWVPQGRPVYTGLTPAQAYAEFINYYWNLSPPLSTYLLQAPSDRPYQMAAVTDYPANTFYAFDMGVDLCLLERAIDELGDISTGIAFLRGAARQYDRRWGIDISTWRQSNGMATQFNSQGVLLGGWSPSYLRRHDYIAYMSGAHVLLNEATTYYQQDNQLNPFGQMTSDFANFALSRHPDVGRPVISTALMIDPNSGFDPKHWIYTQTDTVWYGDIPYTAGDQMINNFLKLAYPTHWLHGLAPGAPFADASGIPNPAQFQTYLAAGGDPRPYEPMGSTRYGDNLDIITADASLDTLWHYRNIVVLGDVVIDDGLHDALATWVSEGGTLVVSASQVTSADQDLLGVTLGTTTRTASQSLWLADQTVYNEGPYSYTAVTPGTATVLATNNGSDPLITSNPVGIGAVIFVAAPYLQTSAGNALLAAGVRLLDSVATRNSIAQISGPPIEYILNYATGKIIVTLVNNTGQDWNGTLTMVAAGAVTAVREYISDQDCSSSVVGRQVTIAAHVAPYDVAVYATEFRAKRPPRPGLRPGARKGRQRAINESKATLGRGVPGFGN
jgi:hypothetical protein